MQSKPRCLFVYGTLRKTGSNCHVLYDGFVFVSIGQIAGKLYFAGGFPGATLAKNGEGFVMGELYEFRDEETLNRLDVFEGYNPAQPRASVYTRRLVRVTRESGKKESAWAYLLRKVPRDAQHIPDGDYLAWLKK